ncbi:MAG: hypothetical protein IJV41_00100 [Oscillospiraceae bacterium]|nr:hypothetical protein [Oscillospiraceae bacterium]
MKNVKKLLVLACLGCLGFGTAKLLKTDAAQEKLFALLGEDTYLAILDKARLLGDLLMWPIDFVRALLP